MQNAQMVILNAVRATTQVEKTHKVHTLESLYEAFESFISTMVNDENSGVPFGFNYRQIHPLEIQEAKNRAKIQYFKLLQEGIREEILLGKILEEEATFAMAHPELKRKFEEELEKFEKKRAKISPSQTKTPDNQTQTPQTKTDDGTDEMG